MKNVYINKKIYTYILISMTLLLLMTMLYFFYNVIPNLRNNDKIINQNKLKTVEKNIENYLNGQIIQNQELSKFVENVSSSNELSSELDKFITLNKYFDRVMITNDNYSYGNIELDKEYLSNTLNSKQTSILEKNNNGVFKIYIVTATSVLNQSGYVVTEVDIQSIHKIIDQIDGASKVIGMNGDIILQNNPQYQITNKQLNEIVSKYQTLNVPVFDQKSNVVMIGDINFDSMLLGQWSLVNIMPKDDFYLLSNNSINRTLMGFVLIILFVLIIFIFIGNKIIKAFSKIVEWISSISNNNYDIVASTDSFLRDINKKFDSMVENIKQSREKYEKQTEELSEKNWEIEEANRELELSYQKLQETINQLNEAEEKYYTLVKNLPEIICVIELDGTITYTNDAVEDILGYTKEELIEQNISMIFTSELTRKLLYIMNKKLKRQRKIVLETPVFKKEGKEIIVEIKLTYHFRNGDVDGVQAIVRDVTKNRSLQNEIIHKNKEILTIYNISKSLSSTIEINNVFNLIVNEVCKIFDANYCVLRTFDESKRKLILRSYTGKFFDGVSESQIFDYTYYDADFLQEIIKSKKIVQEEQFDKYVLTREINKLKPDYEKVTNVITIPICSKHEVLGIITIGTRDKIPHKNVNILMSVANNAAVAIENATLYENSKKYFLKTIDALIAAVDAKDKYTQGHSRRVAKYSEAIATVLDLPSHIIEDLKIAGILHDIGKIGISDNILLKPGTLSDEEYEEIKQHPIISNRILYSVGLSDTTLKAISLHHERFDGKGYPFGVQGEDLSIEVQVIAVADAFDAMTSTRSYREALSIDKAIRELVKHKGTQFGPAVIDAIVKIYNEEPEILIEISKVVDLAG